MSTNNRAEEDLAYIRNYYNVPARMGGRVTYFYPAPPKMGTIVGADGAHLLIRLDGEDFVGRYHPTWCLTYHDSEKDPA